MYLYLKDHFEDNTTGRAQSIGGRLKVLKIDSGMSSSVKSFRQICRVHILKRKDHRGEFETQKITM